MSIPILVEPSEGGFRASTGGPLDLSTEANSATEAINALQKMIAHRFQKGAVIVEQPIPAPASPIPIVPLAENPLFDEWLAAVEEYRTERDLEERAEAGEAI